jgi:3-hydroxyisobutyrate dehydrogenase
VEERALKKIGFIGVGNIGAPMAQRLIEKEYELVVCDSSSVARAAFSGITSVTGSPCDCADADLVILMVADDEQLRQAVLGPCGVASGIRSELPPLIAIMSTVMPETVREVAAAVSPSGAFVVDAPVSGGAVRARKGTLAIMVGGERGHFNLLRPVLDALGTAVHHCGDLGSGELTKIINNMVGVTNLFLFAEAMQIGARYGLDLARLSAIMETGSGRNNGTRDWPERQALYRYNSEMPATLDAIVEVTRKDLRHAEAIARTAGLDCQILTAVVQAHERVRQEDLIERWREVSRDCRDDD